MTAGKTKPDVASIGRGGDEGSGRPHSRAYRTTSRARCQDIIMAALPTELRGLSSSRARDRFLSAICAAALLELWADCEGGAR
jgi:hypothetical protein